MRDARDGAAGVATHQFTSLSSHKDGGSGDGGGPARCRGSLRTEEIPERASQTKAAIMLVSGQEQ